MPSSAYLKNDLWFRQEDLWDKSPKAIAGDLRCCVDDYDCLMAMGDLGLDSQLEVRNFKLTVYT
jgi:hypothetical protein